MKCVICSNKINGHGNNAEPYSDGICCDECNYTVVVPLRIQEFLISKKADKLDSGN